eukprot:8619219-Alexandrium_andersonii.AAC.1
MRAGPATCALGTGAAVRKDTTHEGPPPAIGPSMPRQARPEASAAAGVLPDAAIRAFVRPTF